MIELANDTLAQFFEGQLTSEQADDLLVISTTSAMALALKEEREVKGRSGWHTTAVTNDQLYNRLQANLYEPRSLKSLSDIINLAAMLRVRMEVYGSQGALPDPLHLDRRQATGHRISDKCSVCGEPQLETPSGVTCSNDHGGAEPA